MLAGTVTFTGGLWAHTMMEPLGLFEYIVAGAVLVIVVISLIMAKGRLRDEKMGIPPEDELTNAIKQKAAAMTFVSSFYVWLVLLVFTVDSDTRAEVPLGIGILAMGIIFFGFWLYYSKMGIENENAH